MTDVILPARDHSALLERIERYEGLLRRALQLLDEELHDHRKAARLAFDIQKALRT